MVFNLQHLNNLEVTTSQFWNFLKTRIVLVSAGIQLIFLSVAAVFWI